MNELNSNLGNVYSTEETRIGSWIDGSPVYRKVYEFGSFPNNTTKYIDLNIENFKRPIEIKTIWKDTNDTNNGDIWIQAPRLDSSSILCRVDIQKEKLPIVGTGTNWSTRTADGIVILTYLKN